jgi:excisionase family DNA binding protein
MIQKTSQQREPLMRVGDVAKIVQMSTRHIYREVSAGRLRAIKMGRNRRFLPADVDRWIDAFASH